MSRIKLDLSRFQHLRSDEHTTTLQHKQDGHQITLIHSALSKPSQEQLKALAGAFQSSETPLQAAEKPQYAEGKMVTSNTGYKGIESEDKKPSKSIDFSNFPKETNKKNREAQIEDRKKKSKQDQFHHVIPAPNEETGTPEDSVQMLAYGGTSQQPQNTESQNEMSPSDMMAFLSKNPALAQAMADHANKYQTQQPNSDQPDEPEYEEAQVPMSKDQQDEAQALSNQMVASGTIPGVVADDRAPGQEPKDQVTNHPTGDLPDPNANVAPAGPNVLNTYPQAVAGAIQQGQAQGKISDTQTQAYNETVNQLQAQQNQFQQNFDDSVKENQLFLEDYNKGHIDPNHYIENMSTLQKIGTAVGLLISGVGAGLAHQSNMAYDFLNKQIDRDIAAQQVNLGKQNNLLGANIAYMGNLRAGIEQTKANLLSILGNKLSMAVTQQGTPMAQASMKMYINDLATKQQSALQNAAALRGTKLNLGSESHGASGAWAPQGNTGGYSAPQSQHTVTQNGQNENVNDMIGLNMSPRQQQKEKAFQSNISGLMYANPEYAKQLQDHHIPGFDQQTSIPVEPADRNAVPAYQILDNELGEILKANQQYPILDKMPGPIRSRLQYLMGDIGSRAAVAEGAGIVTPDQKRYINEMVGKGPQALDSAWNSIPKLETMRTTQRQKYAEMLHSKYGLNVTAPGSPLSGKSEQPKYKIYNGRKYRRGPNGEAIPVD